MINEQVNFAMGFDDHVPPSLRLPQEFARPYPGAATIVNFRVRRTKTIVTYRFSLIVPDLLGHKTPLSEFDSSLIVRDSDDTFSRRHWYRNE